MVKLKNLKRIDQKIQCDIYPEDSTEAGQLSVNLSDESYDYKLPKGYEWCTNHVAHAKRAIIEMVKADSELPKEKLIMWG